MFSASDILGRNFSILSAGLDGLAMRERLHAENIANIDTEGYQARTVDFESTLKNAIDEPSNSPLGANGAGLPNSVSDAAVGSGALQSNFQVKATPGAPGVNKDHEVSEMMNDNIRFRVLSQQVTNRISELRSVIAEIGRS